MYNDFSISGLQIQIENTNVQVLQSIIWTDYTEHQFEFHRSSLSNFILHF